MIINSFIQLVRLGIGHSAEPISKKIDWNAIEAYAARQGLSAIVLDGIGELPDNQRPSKEVLLQWIGNTLQCYESRYGQYRRTIAEMAGWYNSHGFKMMVLKGYACSLDWPKPEHRPCGDIDIWLFGQQKEADATLEAGLKVQDSRFKVDKSHHHHTVFYWKDFMVENHYDFLDTNTRKSSSELELVLKELGTDDSYTIDVNGERVYLPAPNLHALFLIRHMVDHFTSVSISLRQVLDWAFFVEKHTAEIDWKWLVVLLEKYHMKDFYNCINAISVENLGFPVNIFQSVQFDPNLKEKIFNDIINPKFTEIEPGGFIQRMIYKYRRWQGNAWKQELCYPESRSLTFFKGLRAHMAKPKSI